MDFDPAIIAISIYQGHHSPSFLRGVGLQRMCWLAFPIRITSSVSRTTGLKKILTLQIKRFSLEDFPTFHLFLVFIIKGVQLQAVEIQLPRWSSWRPDGILRSLKILDQQLVSYILSHLKTSWMPSNILCTWEWNNKEQNCLSWCSFSRTNLPLNPAGRSILLSRIQKLWIQMPDTGGVGSRLILVQELYQ